MSFCSPPLPQPMRCVNTSFSPLQTYLNLSPRLDHTSTEWKAVHTSTTSRAASPWSPHLLRKFNTLLCFPAPNFSTAFHCVARTLLSVLFRAPWLPQPSMQCQHMSFFPPPLGCHSQCVVSTHVFFAPPPPWPPQPMRCFNTCFAAPDI